MSCVLPLLRCWHICGENMPEELFPGDTASGFSLPGADALSEFADLLGDAADSAAPESASDSSVPFALPAMIPDSVSGKVVLSCQIDFGLLSGDYAVLTLDHITGSGCIMLGDRQIAAFDSASSHRTIAEAFDLTAVPCMLAVDLSGALLLHRKETLSIRFDEQRPAGVSGPVILRTARLGRLSRVHITPDAAQQTLTLHAKLAAMRAGRFILNAQPVMPNGTADAVRSVSCRLAEGESSEAEMTFCVPFHIFRAGVPYDACALKITLLHQKEETSFCVPCDSVTLMCGYPGKASAYALPLTAGESAAQIDALCARLESLHIPSVRLNAPAPDAFYRAMTRAGVSVRMPDNIPFRPRLERLPCACFVAERVGEYAAVSPAGSAWQMGSMVQLPRPVDPTLSAKELLEDVSGLMVDPSREDTASILAWLRAVSVRMRAEAARQGRFSGALCAPGEWNISDIAESLRTAFAPLHLSALPLYGAWWTSSRFSAAIHAFIPGNAYTADDPLIAHAVLEDEHGSEIARLRAPCKPAGGYIGVLEAALPAQACVLTLDTRLTLHDETVEESAMPVYVGERGPLEAAFRRENA